MGETSLTVPLSAEIEGRLGQLADHTRRDRSALAAEAIADFVERELANIEAIERARAEVRAGAFRDHDDVMAAARAIIDEARRAK